MARLWDSWAGDCVTVFHMLSRVCVYVHDNVHAYVYVHASCLKDSPHCHRGIWGDGVRTLLCLCMHWCICTI